jgi:hypothetical protein
MIDGAIAAVLIRARGEVNDDLAPASGGAIASSTTATTATKAMSSLKPGMTRLDHPSSAEELSSSNPINGARHSANAKNTRLGVHTNIAPSKSA